MSRALNSEGEIRRELTDMHNKIRKLSSSLDNCILNNGLENKKVKERKISTRFRDGGSTRLCDLVYKNQLSGQINLSL